MLKIFGFGIAAITVAAFASTAFATDGAAVFKAKCVACHGADGAGTAMAPAFKGSDYVKKSKDEEIAAVITNGREGAAKKYKQFALAMPKQTLSADEVKAVVAHLRTLAGK